jgi:hypothetical protein
LQDSIRWGSRSESNSRCAHAVESPGSKYRGPFRYDKIFEYLMNGRGSTDRKRSREGDLWQQFRFMAPTCDGTRFRTDSYWQMHAFNVETIRDLNVIDFRSLAEHQYEW